MQLGAAEAVKPSTTSRCSVRGPRITLMDKKDLVMSALPPAKEEKVGSAMLEWPRSELTESNRKESLRVLSTPDRASIKVIVLSKCPTLVPVNIKENDEQSEIVKQLLKMLH